MALTDAQYLAWLQSGSAIRCVLVEASVRSGGAETVRYLSSANYTTGAGDTPVNMSYLAVIGGGVTITEKLSIDGSASLSFGDIEIDNTGGAMDSWLGDVWVNRAVNVYCGDVRWPRSDFRLVFSGTLAGIGSRTRNTLNLDLRDKLQRLNTPLSENKLGGATDNKDRLRPLCFGECHNIEPLLVNPATLEYQVHDGAIEAIIEVRDNGVPISYTASVSTGTFALLAQPAGIITCSVQGDKLGGIYRNTVGALVQRIVMGYGKAADRFDSGDLDAANLAAFESANPQPVGLYIADRTNVLQACALLASSVGAQLVMSRTGLLRLLKIALPAAGAATAVGAGQMAERTLRIADRPDVVASAQIGYCRNWTVQNTLQSGIPEAHKALFAQEWLTTTASDTTTATTYKLSAEPEQADTLLLTVATAAAEASRRLALWAVQRNVYGYTGTPALMLESLGGAQTLTHGRFGLSAGVTGQVVGITQDWLAGRVEFEVLA